MKSPAEFHIYFPRVVKVESSKGEAVVEQHPAICHIHCGKRNPVLIAIAKRLSQRNVERGVPGEIVPRIARPDSRW